MAQPPEESASPAKNKVSDKSGSPSVQKVVKVIKVSGAMPSTKVSVPKSVPTVSAVGPPPKAALAKAKVSKAKSAGIESPGTAPARHGDAGGTSPTLAKVPASAKVGAVAKRPSSGSIATESSPAKVARIAAPADATASAGNAFAEAPKLSPVRKDDREKDFLRAAREELTKPDEPAKSSSWREFQQVDPVYAIIGELGERKVFTSGSTEADEEVLRDYLTRLMQPDVARKSRDWVEVWAAMKIPIESQHEVVQAILEIGLESEVAETIPDVLAELVKGHRVKVKAVEESIVALFECGADQKGCLARFLFLLFPKSPSTEWGWARTGWSWQQWWMTANRILNTLEGTNAFDCLCDLLRAIEAESGSYLPHQQIWDEMRLRTVRKALCDYGGFLEDELASAVDVCLA